MISFLRSAAGKRRDEARDLLRHAAKVLRYRSDVLAPAALAEITGACDELSATLADKASGDEALKAGVGKLDAPLRRHGGKIYPLGAGADWTETFVIAAILAGGVRAFVFQPFKIPTNSMYPTYHGMTAEVYAAGRPEPSAAEKVWRKIVLGATHFAPVTPVAGEVLIPLSRTAFGGANFERAEKAVDDGILGTGLFKGAADGHALVVAGTRVPVVTPAKFSFESALLAAYFPEEAGLPVPEQKRWERVFSAATARGDLVVNGDGVLLRTHKTVRAGEPMLRFDVLSGDMVIADRMSYNFTGPRLGDAFVFRTRDVPGMKRPDGSMPDDFYIKRLVGLPGDTLRVEAPKLIRNGAPVSGKVGFDFNNAARTDLGYYGYLPELANGAYPLADDRTIPAGHYWAMGDNSANSWDSRGWGPVPEKAVVGRAIFILYPFTARWGVAK